MPQFFSISDAAEYLGVSSQTLRRWDEDGSFKATFVSPGGHRYYSLADLQKRTKGLFQIAKEWASAAIPAVPASEFYCPAKDVFKTRLDRMALELASHPAGSIITSATGEIGNNSFDHNIGNWPDILGAFFSYDLGKRIVVLADRGQGILATLKHARPSLNDDETALRVAFTEILTGREPEHRGNGLKYVKEVVSAFDLELLFQSGEAVLTLKKGDSDFSLTRADHPIRGCLSLIKF